MAIHDFAELLKERDDLEAAGIPLEPLENRVGRGTMDDGTDLTIRVGRERQLSVIRELKDGRFAYILPIFVRRDRPGKTIIRECWIEPPWLDTSVEFVEDPSSEERHPGYYNLPGNTERFMRESVLNHRMNGRLSRGDIREGFLLAVGSRPPETYKNHEKIEVAFGILDEWDHEHIEMLQMVLNRLPTRAKATSKSTRSPLLSRPDLISTANPLVAPPESPEEDRTKYAEAYCRILEGIARFQTKVGHKDE